MRRLSTFALVLSLAIAGCHSAETGRPRIDPALAAFIPPDTVALAGIRMDELRTTPLYLKLLAQRDLPQFDEFAAKTGFDPRRDVRDFLAASNGKDTVVMARGNFRVTVPPSARRSSYKGYTLYGKDEGAFAFIDKTTALAGTPAALRAAIDQYKSGNHAGLALLARAQALSGQNQIWAVSQGWTSFLGNALPSTGNAANFHRIIRSLEDATFAADLRSGLHATATGHCKTEQDAKALGDAARGLVGLGRLSVPENRPELLRLYDGIQIEQQQRSLKMVAAIPQDLLDEMLKMIDAGSRVSRPAAPSAGRGAHRPISARRLP